MLRQFILIISCFLFFQCTKNQKLDPGKPSSDLLQSAKEIIASTKTCALTTYGLDSYPRVRTMGPFAPEEDMAIWFATNPKSRKVDEIKNNPNVGLYYVDNDDSGYVSIYGTAELINDPIEKSKRWKDEWKAFYPDREESYILIKVTPKRLEIISESRNILGDPDNWTPATYVF